MNPIVAEYPYFDLDGRVVYETVRFAPKDFRQRCPDGVGGWTWALNGVQRIPYRWKALTAAANVGGTVFVVEGEKDADRLVEVGLVATTSAGGAGWEWPASWAEHFRGCGQVVVVADNDEPGRRAASQRAEVVAATVPDVRLLELPGLDEHGDVSDWLDAGGTVAELWELAEGAPQVGAAPALAASPNFFLDWAEFWARDRRDADWLLEDVLARGRGHSIFAGHKVGKSLLMLSFAAELVGGDAVVIYLDYEMGEDDLYDRLADMGYGPETDLSGLHYALLPSLPPLDSLLGATELFDRVDAVAAEHPGANIAVVIDTTARAVAGEENSADTYRAFYRWTGLGLKQRGVTWARLDHAGKDATKGQRGSSGKGDDVDVVWRLVATENGLELHREASRMGWVPEKVTFAKREDPLRFERVAEDWPAGTRETADLLDALGVEPTAGVRQASQALREANDGRRTTVVMAAQRWRRQRAEEGHR